MALVTGDIEQGIYAALAKHVQGELEALGLDLVLFNLGHREDRLRHFLERAPSLGLRGIVLSSPHVMDMDELMPVIETATKSGVEILSVSQDLSPFGITSIIHDDVGGAASAVAHLLDRGSAPIAFVGRIATSAIGRARFDGYRDALLAHGQNSTRAGLGHLAGLSRRCRLSRRCPRRWPRPAFSRRAGGQRRAGARLHGRGRRSRLRDA